MNRRIAIMVWVFVLCVGAEFFCPEQSPAQFCQDFACATVISFGPTRDLVLCQSFRPLQVDYAFCRPTGEPRVWECDRSIPRDLPKVWLTETEWANDSIRCAKLCGDCRSGWKAASQP